MAKLKDGLLQQGGNTRMLAQIAAQVELGVQRYNVTATCNFEILNKSHKGET